MSYQINVAIMGFASLLMPGCAPRQTSTDSTHISAPNAKIIESSEMDAAPQADSTADAKQIPVRSAFIHDKDLHRVLLDTQIAPPQKETFWLGLGSVTIETVSVSEGVLKLRYTFEIEGGYSMSECDVDISPTPLVFQFGSDGTPGRRPNELRNCKPIRTGNVHTDLSNIENEGGV